MWDYDEEEFGRVARLLKSMDLECLERLRDSVEAQDNHPDAEFACFHIEGVMTDGDFLCLIFTEIEIRKNSQKILKNI